MDTLSFSLSKGQKSKPVFAQSKGGFVTIPNPSTKIFHSISEHYVTIKSYASIIRSYKSLNSFFSYTKIKHSKEALNHDLAMIQSLRILGKTGFSLEKKRQHPVAVDVKFPFSKSYRFCPLARKTAEASLEMANGVSSCKMDDGISE